METSSAGQRDVAGSTRISGTVAKKYPSVNTRTAPTKRWSSHAPMLVVRVNAALAADTSYTRGQTRCARARNTSASKPLSEYSMSLMTVPWVLDQPVHAYHEPAADR